jgi:hypothetical protein
MHDAARLKRILELLQVVKLAVGVESVDVGWSLVLEGRSPTHRAVFCEIDVIVVIIIIVVVVSLGQELLCSSLLGAEFMPKSSMRRLKPNGTGLE